MAMEDRSTNERRRFCHRRSTSKGSSPYIKVKTHIAAAGSLRWDSHEYAVSGRCLISSISYACRQHESSLIQLRRWLTRSKDQILSINILISGLADDKVVLLWSVQPHLLDLLGPRRVDFERIWDLEAYLDGFMAMHEGLLSFSLDSPTNHRVQRLP
jgi:hypothetical protein